MDAVEAIARLGFDESGKDFSVLHAILRRHLSAGNGFAVQAALSLPEIHRDPKFWETCDYRCGLASALLSARVERSGETQQQTAADGTGGGVSQLLALSQSNVELSADGTATQSAPDLDDDLDAATAPLSLNEVFVLLKSCESEAPEMVTEIIDAVGGVEGNETELDVAQLATKLFENGFKPKDDARSRRAAQALSRIQRDADGRIVRQIEVAPPTDAIRDAMVDVDDVLDANGEEAGEFLARRRARLELPDRFGAAAAQAPAATPANQKAGASPTSAKSGTSPEQPRLSHTNIADVALPGTVQQFASFDDVGNDAPAARSGGSNSAAGGASATRAPAPKQKRRAWTKAEDDAIIDGIGKFHGPSRFTMILAANRNIFHAGRTPTQIADHWRQVLKGRATATTIV